MRRTMKLLVIRHGESEADLLYVHEGRADFCIDGKRPPSGGIDEPLGGAKLFG